MNNIVKDVKDYVSEACGTAGEAHQMWHFNQLKATYGEQTALNILEPHLQELDLTIADFQSYQKVKRKIQNGTLNIGEIKQEIKKSAQNSIAEVLA